MSTRDLFAKIHASVDRGPVEILLKNGTRHRNFKVIEVTNTVMRGGGSILTIAGFLENGSWARFQMDDIEDLLF